MVKQALAASEGLSHLVLEHAKGVQVCSHQHLHITTLGRGRGRVVLAIPFLPSSTTREHCVSFDISSPSNSSLFQQWLPVEQSLRMGQGSLCLTTLRDQQAEPDTWASRGDLAVPVEKVDSLHHIPQPRSDFSALFTFLNKRCDII